MATTHSRTAKAKSKASSAPHARVKGETVEPINTLLLVKRLGVTRAHREIGVSTTTLHKARKQGIVSKVVEIAATAALSHLGSTAAAPPEQPHREAQAPLGRSRLASIDDSVMLLVSVDRSKAELIQDFAARLGAEVKAY